MSEPSSCALCRRTPGPGEPPLGARPLVPRRFLESGAFEIDPLGTAGASAALCRDCAAVLEAPMLLPEDLQELSRAVALHAEQHPPASVRDQQAACARLLHRALHLGARALVAELAPAAVAARREPDQLRLFASKTARLAKVEDALAEGRLEAARLFAEELVRNFDLPEARYLASRLGPIAQQVAWLHAEPGELEQLAEQPDKLLDPHRLTVSLSSAFARGLHKLVRAARGAPSPGEPSP